MGPSTAETEHMKIQSASKQGLGIKSELNCDSKRENEFASFKNPFSCSQFGKAFTYPSQLKMHERIHTDEKPFCYKNVTRDSVSQVV